MRLEGFRANLDPDEPTVSRLLIIMICIYKSLKRYMGVRDKGSGVSGCGLRVYVRLSPFLCEVAHFFMCGLEVQVCGSSQ